MKGFILISLLVFITWFGSTGAYRQPRCLSSGVFGCNPRSGSSCCGNLICAKGDSYPGTCVDEQKHFNSGRPKDGSCVSRGQFGCNPNRGLFCCNGKICAKGNSYPGTCVDEQKPIYSYSVG